jgi:hypothetical protein
MALALTVTNSLAQTKAPTIPQQYRGEWVSALEDCGTGVDDTRLFIGSRTLSFYESGGTVRALVSRGSFEITLILAMSEEDQTWISPKQFKLSADGRTLTDTTTQGYGNLVRYRCPKR